MSSACESLEGFLGKNITEICLNGFVADSENHCAHFVSHALGYSFGYTCSDQTGKHTAPGGNLRVHEIFWRCPQVGLWGEHPRDKCLVFITKRKNVNLMTKIMVNDPKKHVGIYHGGQIYHYSNTYDRVVKQTPVEFSGHYRKPYNEMFFGKFPQ